MNAETVTEASDPKIASTNTRRFEVIQKQGLLERIALRITDWSERWYPDAFIFAMLAVLVVALGCLAIGASPGSITSTFGAGFWTLIPFTMQVALGVITGFVVAHSKPASWLIKKLARFPKSGRGAVAYIGFISMSAALVSWTVSLIFSGLLVRQLARREDLRMDYRAAGAAGYLGVGAIWALGISSAAAQIQANPASLPKALIPITGVISFQETIFLWQSMTMAAVLIVVSTLVAYLSAPGPNRALTSSDLGVPLLSETAELPRPQRPGDWLEYSPVLTLFIVLIGAGWLVSEFRSKSTILAISNLNTYNFLLLMLGLLLHWRPRNFLRAVSDGVPSVGGILIQFPLYGSIAAMLIGAKGTGGLSLGDHLASFFVHMSSSNSFGVVLAIYTAVLGFFMPSGGGKWVLEAPYFMRAANELHFNLGWTVQIYNVSEALPNLINPFFMLPLLGILGLKARDLIGFTCTQFLVNVPLVLVMVWVLGTSLHYHPPILP